jgi:hypothetical protein
MRQIAKEAKTVVHAIPPFQANPLGTKSHVRKPNPARDTRC